MNNNLVSIITPSYNSSKYISETILSVLNQTYEHWEMIIVDDASSDHSNEIINEYIKKDNRIKLIKLKNNSGAAVARNRAIKESQGRYIAFLYSDDIWFPEKLEKQINFMQNKGVALCYSSYSVIDEDSNIINKFQIPKNKINYKELLRSCIIGNLTAVYDTKAIGLVYAENIAIHQDYTLWLKILKKIDYAYGLNETLAKYRVSSKSNSGNKLKSAMWQWHIYRKIERLSFFQSTYYFIQYAYYGITKYR